MCVPTAQPTEEGIPIYRPEKLYCVQDEDSESVFKTFKFEVAQVRTHYERQGDVSDVGKSTQTVKKRLAEQHVHQPPGFGSPGRRLKVQKTADATTAGVSREVYGSGILSCA